MEIVSGRTGSPHVTSQQFRQFVEGTVGQESYILASGENLEPELASNNILKIRSGMMSHHGNISGIKIGTYDEVELTNGSQGMKRIDLVVNRYTRNAETNVEANGWVVIMGTPVASNPSIPAYTVGNLQEGDLTDDCPVFEIHYDGLNVTAVKKVIETIPNIDKLQTRLAELTALTEKYHSFDFLPVHKNGTLSNALLVGLTDPYHDNNKTRYVNANSAVNLPADCQWGVREVSFVGTNFIIVRITGWSTKNVMAYWENCYVNGKWLGWQTFSPVSTPIKANNVTRMLQRTAVYTGTGGTSVALLSYENVRKWFGVTNVSNENVCVFAMNGDGGASGIHIDGTTWAPSEGVCYATFNKALATGSRVRINMLITYNGS